MRRLLLLLPCLLAVACSELPDGPDGRPPVTEDEPLVEIDAVEVLQQAAARHGVPLSLVQALAWSHSSFALVEEGHAEEDAHSHPGYGLLGLTDDGLDLAVQACDCSADEIMEDPEVATDAAVALLGVLRDLHAPDADPEELTADWWEPVVRFGEAQFDASWMAHDLGFDIFRTLQDGLVVETPDGQMVSIDRHELSDLAKVDHEQGPQAGAEDYSGSTDYPGTHAWVPAHSSNQSSRSGGASAVRRVVLHTTEGSYAGAISWFGQSRSNVSAHYVIRRSDGQVTQMVRDDRKAWHACRNNNDTIGIEHEGASFSPSQWTPAVLDSSARLTAWLVDEYDIPLDRDHIVGHGEIQPSSCSGRSDPGPYFPWDEYMELVASYVDGGSGPSTTASSVDFLTPRDDMLVADPVVARVRSTDVARVELWRGPYRLGLPSAVSPTDAVLRLDLTGDTTLTARGYNAAGSVVATDTVNFTVAAPTHGLTVSGMPIDDGWYFTAEAPVAATEVRYYVDGFPIGLSPEPERDFGIFYRFSDTGLGRLLQARAHAIDGTLLAENMRYIDVLPTASGDGSILDWWAEPSSGRRLVFGAEATEGITRIEYRVDGAPLTDADSGASAGTDTSFSLTHSFGTPGRRAVELRAYDAAGALVDSAAGEVWAPSPTVQIDWSVLSDGAYQFTIDAPGSTREVRLLADGSPLVDRWTGEAAILHGPPWQTEVVFENGGLVEVVAEARNDSGNLLDDESIDLAVVGGGGAPTSGSGDCPPGHVCLTELPFAGVGSTSLSGLDRWDAYSCAPSTRERGPEAVYEVPLPGPGTLDVTVTDGVGVDVDVHILSELDPDSCISRGDISASAELAGGTAYVVVDTWTNSAGRSLPGLFAIDIQFAASTTPTTPSCPAGFVCPSSPSFVHAATTEPSFAVLDSFDSYSCAPGINESGREVVYRVELPSDGVLSASLVDGSGVDIDVHLLSDYSASACVARGHTNASASMSAGTRYIVADTWVTSRGSALAGAYTLTVDFSPTAAAEPPPPPPVDCPDDIVCVNSLPWSGSGSTDPAVTPWDNFDAYNCASSINMSGREQIYQVEMATSGVLHAQIFEPSWVDVDVHILTALDANSCEDRGNDRADAWLPAGTHYVVIDTWVNSSDRAFYGPYELEIWRD